MSSYVTCRICGKKFKSLQRHVKCAHNISSQEYKSRYPNDKMINDDQIRRLVTNNRSEKQRQILIERNKSEKMRKMISERNKDPEFRKKVKEGMNKPEVKKAQSERMSKRSKEMWKDPEYREQHRKIARETQKRLNKNPEVIKRKTELFRSLWRDPEISKRMLNSHKKSPFGKPVRYKDYYCRSQGEYEAIVALESIGATNIELEKYRIPYNTDHTYIPDISCIYEGITYIIEVKYSETPSDYYDKVVGALEYCNKNGYKYCWLRRFIDIPQIEKEKSLDFAVVNEVQVKEI